MTKLVAEYNATRYPHDQKARTGYRVGHGEVVDGMIKDGLWDVYSEKGSSMSREQQDDYSIRSYERAIAATNAGVFQWEMVPVEVPGGRGKPSVIVQRLTSRHPRCGQNEEALA
ncbi:hypothetical protein R1sor_013540 [Riccia sorocarpa]|uniref:Thiolase N-terminal domain-containing protein n=1 Tax=Riccia sorocarpa TaxID=122646 RepID=A0ABD3H8Q7_9MARC